MSMTKPKACKTCWEIGTSKECPDEWPHGHTRHLVKGCPTSQVTCFLCEGPNHVQIQCQLYPFVQQVIQQTKEGMQQSLMKTLEAQEQKVKSKKDLSHINCYKCKEQGHYSSNCIKKKIGKDTEPNHCPMTIIVPTKMENEVRVKSHPKISKSTSSIAISVKKIT